MTALKALEIFNSRVSSSNSSHFRFDFVSNMTPKPDSGVIMSELSNARSGNEPGPSINRGRAIRHGRLGARTGSKHPWHGALRTGNTALGDWHRGSAMCSCISNFTKQVFDENLSEILARRP